MDKITLQKKTVEEAVLEGLKLLGAKREDVIVHVLDEGQKGFLGLIGNKDAKVTIIKKDSPDAINYVDNERDAHTKNAHANLIEDAKESIKDTYEDAKDAVSEKYEESGMKEKVDEATEKIKDFATDAKESVKEFATDAKESAEDFAKNASDKVSAFGSSVKEAVDNKFDDKKESAFEQFGSKEEAAEACRIFLEDMMHKMGYAGVVETIPPIEEDENYVLDIIPDDYKMNSRFIGKKGETLSTIGYLVNVFLRNRFAGDMMIEVDCGDYVYEKQEDLKSFARMAADRALNEGEYKIRPMNAYDRRIVHREINKIDGVTTHSEGEEPRRRIVVTRDPQ